MAGGKKYRTLARINDGDKVVVEAGREVRLTDEQAKPFLSVLEQIGGEEPEPGERDERLTAGASTLGGANPNTGETGVGPDRTDATGSAPTADSAGAPKDLGTPRDERNALDSANAGSGPVRPGAPDATTRAFTPRTLAANASVDEVEAEYNARVANGMPAATGSGADGKLVKRDMVAALEADDARRAGR